MAKFNTKRQKVHMSDTIYDHEIRSGALLSVLIDRLMGLQRKHSENAMVELDVDSGECCASVNIAVSSQHDETDEEYDKRYEQHKIIEQHKNQQAYLRKKQREEQDCKDFARLTKKFGKK